MRKQYLFLSLAPILLTVACATRPAAVDGPTAVANLEPRSASTASGTVRFTETPGGVVVVDVDLRGVPPGAHGFHVHEVGDCSAMDASSAGGHFDPAGAPHGGPGMDRHHAGDLGNVTADRDGRVQTTISTGALTVTPGDRSVVGRAVVLHADPDDLASQPAGNAGKRIACGVVVASPMQ